MENELKHLTETILSVLDRYEKHLDKGTPTEALEPHKNILSGLMEKIKAVTVKPMVANMQPLRIGGQLPGPTNPQNQVAKIQVEHGASDDAGIKQSVIEKVPTVQPTDTRPVVAVDTIVTTDNIDQLADALTENDSLVEPVIQGVNEAK